MKNLPERILDGVERGVNRHWRYTKNLLEVKPEYLLTISVADEICSGFDGINGIDISIGLEEKTTPLAGQIVLEKVGMDKYFKWTRELVSRKGKVDIFINTEGASHIVELKNFDPSTVEVEKELVRLSEFLLLNEGNNTCVSSHVAFPTLTEKEEWISAVAKKLLENSNISYTLSSKYIVTDEDPEDGIPAFHCYCINLQRM